MYAGWNAARLGSVIVAVVQFLSLVSRIDGAVSMVMFTFILLPYALVTDETRCIMGDV